MTSIKAPKMTRMRCVGMLGVAADMGTDTSGEALQTVAFLLQRRHGEDREDRAGVARGARPRAVPRAAAEGHRGALHRRVRSRVRAGHLRVRRVWHGALRVG